MKTRAVEPRLPMPQGSPAELMRVFEAARRFVACRARAAELAGTAPSLAMAIERDFLIFDLGLAERALHAAVLAIDPAPMLEAHCDAAAGLHRTGA